MATCCHSCRSLFSTIQIVLIRQHTVYKWKKYIKNKINKCFILKLKGKESKRQNKKCFHTFSKHSCPFALSSTSTSSTTEFGCETRHHNLAVDILLSVIIISHKRNNNLKSHCYPHVLTVSFMQSLYGIHHMLSEREYIFDQSHRFYW